MKETTGRLTKFSYIATFCWSKFSKGFFSKGALQHHSLKISISQNFTKISKFEYYMAIWIWMPPLLYRYIIYICVVRPNWNIYENVSQSVSMKMLKVLKTRGRVSKPIFITSGCVEFSWCPSGKSLLYFKVTQINRGLTNFSQPFS